MDKNKQYKTFAFPNKLTPLEIYYYYLLEFGVIPKNIPETKIVEIFSHAAKDYLDGFLSLASISVLASHFAYQFHEYALPPGVGKLLDYCSELTHASEQEIERVKKLLELYVTNAVKFRELAENSNIDEYL